MKRDNINYFAVGMFVLLMLGLLIYGLMRIDGGNRKGDVYYTHFKNVSGIKRGAPVAYQGYELGHVEGIQPVQKDGRTQYRLELNLPHGWKVRADSVARVSSSGLLSGMLVEIREGKSERWLQPGAEIGALDAANLMESMAALSEQMALLLQNDAKPLFNSLNRSAEKIGGSLEKSVPESMLQLQTVLKRLDNTATLLERALGGENLKHVTATLKNADASSANIARLSADLNETRKQLDRMLADAHGLVAHSRPELEASIAELRSALQSANVTLRRLEGASLNTQELTRELRQNPALIIQSKPAVDLSEEKP